MSGSKKPIFAQAPLVSSGYATVQAISFHKKGSEHRHSDGSLIATARCINSSSRFVDTNNLVDPKDALRVFQYRTTSDFSSVEHLRFAVAFQDTPAQFAEIAYHLPGRTYQECIHHYRMYKDDGRFKVESLNERYNRLPRHQLPDPSQLDPSRLPDHDIRVRDRVTKERAPIQSVGEEPEYHNNGRLVRKRAAAMAPIYLSGPTDDEIRRMVPLTEHISDLRTALKIKQREKLLEKSRPPNSRQRLVLPSPINLDLLLKNFDHGEWRITCVELLSWLRSATVLPLLKEWILAIKDSHDSLEKLLQDSEAPYEDQVSDISFLAQTYQLWQPPEPLQIENEEILMLTARFAWRLARANRGMFEAIARPNEYSERYACLDAAFVLLFAFEDYRCEEAGFFATLLGSELAGMIRKDVRAEWEALYSSDGDELAEEFEALDHLFAVAPPARTDTQWQKIFEYEGREGRYRDLEEDVSQDGAEDGTVHHYNEEEDMDVEQTDHPLEDGIGAGVDLYRGEEMDIDLEKRRLSRQDSLGDGVK